MSLIKRRHGNPMATSRTTRLTPIGHCSVKRRTHVNKHWKKQSLGRLDVSKKGSVDEDISHIVSLLNACENYFTTSSCSGRVIIIDGVPESTDIQKQNCVWLFVSHQKCQPEELVSSVSRASGDAVLKFEPFVLHVQCRRLQDAQLLHSVAINSGFRNSGLTVGKTGKIIMAVRSTHGLEVPLSLQGDVLVGQDYIHFLVQVANQKMEENLRRIQRFYQSLHAALSVELRQELHIPDTRELQMPETENGDAAEERKERNVYKRRRRRGRQQQKDEHCSPPELEDEHCSPPELEEEHCSPPELEDEHCSPPELEDEHCSPPELEDEHCSPPELEDEHCSPPELEDEHCSPPELEDEHCSPPELEDELCSPPELEDCMDLFT